MSESNRVALVTGASRGLGEVVARVLAGRGFHVVINARNGDTLRRAAAKLSAGAAAIVVQNGKQCNRRISFQSLQYKFPNFKIFHH